MIQPNKPITCCDEYFRTWCRIEKLRRRNPRKRRHDLLNVILLEDTHFSQTDDWCRVPRGDCHRSNRNQEHCCRETDIPIGLTWDEASSLDSWTSEGRILYEQELMRRNHSIQRREVDFDGPRWVLIHSGEPSRISRSTSASMHLLALFIWGFVERIFINCSPKWGDTLRPCCTRISGLTKLGILLFAPLRYFRAESCCSLILASFSFKITWSGVPDVLRKYFFLLTS